MTWFEPRTSGIGSDRSPNWATTTAQLFSLSLCVSLTLTQSFKTGAIFFDVVSFAANATAAAAASAALTKL